MNFYNLGVRVHFLIPDNLLSNLKYRYVEITGDEMLKDKKKCAQTTFFDIRGNFEIKVFEITRISCI